MLSEEFLKSRTGVEVPEKLFPEIPEYSGCVQDLLHQNSFSGKSGNGDFLLLRYPDWHPEEEI